MIIQFKKESNKPSILTCIRSDGSKTWTKLHPGFEIHDLAHFVVETELGFTKAFYGTVANGFDIGDFEAPRHQRPEALIPVNLSLEALQAEHIVNLLQVSFVKNEENFDFLTLLKGILVENEIEFPTTLNKQRLDQIIAGLRALMHRWNQLQPGDSIDLQFVSS